MKAQPMPQGLTLTPSNPHIRSARSLPFTVALAFMLGCVLGVPLQTLPFFSLFFFKRFLFFPQGPDFSPECPAFQGTLPFSQ